MLQLDTTGGPRRQRQPRRPGAAVAWEGDAVTIGPARELGPARIVVPGDKSVSHRALILGALAQGCTDIANLAPGADVQSTAACLRSLGVTIEMPGHGGRGCRSGETACRVHGRGEIGLAEPNAPLDCGNSGTTMRLLAGVLAGQDLFAVLDGDASLRRRPMDRVAVPLRLMGAAVDGRGGGRFAPLAVRGGGLKGIDCHLPVASAQVKSALLLAGLAARGETVIHEPLPSRDHTERLLAAFGAPIAVDPVGPDGGGIRVTGGGTLSGRSVHVPGDFSQAAWFIVAGLLLPGPGLELPAVGVNPTRTGLLPVLERMGARVEIRGRETAAGCNEPRADIRVGHGVLRATEVEPAEVPLLIDEIPILAVAAACAEGQTRIRGAAELRVKESNRLAAITVGLRTLGADIDETEDGLVIRGPARLRGGMVDGHGDHRIVMALAIAGLAAAEPVTITGADCVGISYPAFFDDLRRAVEGGGAT